jgi:uncharacterized protein YjbI with pentapeptide repeats
MKAQDLLAKYKAGQRDFRGIDLSNENVAWSCLSEADLRESNLQSINLSCANLSRANLSEGANLSFADLSRADLSDVDLRGTNLEGANLEGATLDGALYNEKTIFPRGFNPSSIKLKSTLETVASKNKPQPTNITVQSQKTTTKSFQSPRLASAKIVGRIRINGFLKGITQESTFSHEPSQHTARSNPNAQLNLTNKHDDIHQPIGRWADRESDRNDLHSAELNDLKSTKIAWKIEGENSDDSVSYTYLELDDFTCAKSIEEVYEILEEILQENFKSGANYIVYDFYYIANQICNKLDLTINLRNHPETYTSLTQPSKQEFSSDSQRHTYIGALLVFLSVGLIGLVTLSSLSSNQSISDSIDLGVTSEDIRFGVKKTKTYTNEMATHALNLNKKCIEQKKKDACVEYKRLYDTFLNGGLNIDTGVKIEESKSTTLDRKFP